MKLKYILCSAVAVAMVGLLAGCETEKGEGKEGKEAKESQAQLMAEAKVSQADAERTALARVPGGTIKEEGIEREKGKLIWSFDIATPGTKNITEVAVDAISGNVIAVDIETPSAQEAEKKADAKEKQGKEDDEKK